MSADKSQRDRAAEWVAEHYPDADGAEYEALLAQAIADVVTIDADADAADRLARTTGGAQ